MLNLVFFHQPQQKSELTVNQGQPLKILFLIAVEGQQGATLFNSF